MARHPTALRAKSDAPAVWQHGAAIAAHDAVSRRRQRFAIRFEVTALVPLFRPRPARGHQDGPHASVRNLQAVLLAGRT